MMTNKINRDDLRGIRSPAGYQVFFKLLLGYYLIPMFAADADFDAFLSRFEKMAEDEKRAVLEKAAAVVDLTNEERLNVLCFAKDKNGVPYSAENVGNLPFDEILRITVDVCLAFSEVKVFF